LLIHYFTRYRNSSFSATDCISYCSNSCFSATILPATATVLLSHYFFPSTTALFQPPFTSYSKELFLNHFLPAKAKALFLSTYCTGQNNSFFSATIYKLQQQLFLSHYFISYSDSSFSATILTATATALSQPLFYQLEQQLFLSHCFTSYSN
jgi:hypothetical protein